MAPFAHNFLNNNRYIYELKKIHDQFDKEEPSESYKSRNQVNAKKLDEISALRPERKIYDLMSSSNLEQLNKLIYEISNEYKKQNSTRITKNYAIFLIAPSLLDVELKRTTFNDDCFTKEKASNKADNQIYFQLQTSFKPHVTFEHLQEHINILNCNFDSYFALLRKTDDEEKQKLTCYLKKCKSLHFFQRFFNSFSLNLYQVVL